ncbi:MAG: hypothetical protein JSU74_05380 [Candidatus Zixiibacteriota bacterium]|nr:MAG: hypothetical protein JSU74_05380 [candidate division Zixibacteria bacterium]
MNRSRRQLAVELAVVLILIGLCFGVRFSNLDADAPTDLSTSTDVYTDPAQYTLFSRLYTQAGDLNPFDDNRFAFFLNSAVTPAAIASFKLFGVSVWSSNLVGLFFSFGALLLFYVFVRRCSGILASVLFLLLIMFNYNQLFYGRVPFLEHVMAFFAFLSLVMLVYSNGRLAAVAAGCSLGAGIFFGKMIGLVFLAPFAALLLYEIFYERKGTRYTRGALFMTGFLFVMLVWVFVSYLPMREQVAAYLSEHAFNLYGPPDGLKSVDGFIWKFMSFGDKSRLVERMQLPVVLTAVFIGMILYRATRRESWRSGFGRFNSGHIFIVVMIAAFYGALMIWNYRPLRYQLVLIYPICGAAAFVLSRLWQARRSVSPGRPGYLLLGLYFPMVVVLIYQIFGDYIQTTVGDFYYEDYRLVVAALAVAVTVGIFVLLRQFGSRRIPSLRLTGRVTVIIVTAVVVIEGGIHFNSWWITPAYTARDNGRDLPIVLSKGAVLSGPYATALTLENDLRSVIHMFGVSKADPGLFERFPITHLIVDITNEQRAREDYPAIMDSATEVLSYRIGRRKARLYRIAGLTGNRDSDGYELSEFEKLSVRKSQDGDIFAEQSALEIAGQYPDNMSVYLFLARAAREDSLYEQAEVLLKKAVEFSPTNYNLKALTADFYGDLYSQTGDIRYKEKALRHYEQALMLAPNAGEVEREYEQLKGKQIAGPEEL